ncbi:hypothetical protein IFM89_033226 [Coptis chinensis]|uniref:Uncharacterized protein n=1 Tax=Coptis chinensis TaxID=261450 RepID=A0A835ME62_9MAGN|nr:hypothetical protein IFM89_033226 [Coptis chinensis]
MFPFLWLTLTQNPSSATECRQCRLDRVLQGATDFEETLFLRCHLYCTSGSRKGGDSSSSYARKQSKSSLSVSSPRLTSKTKASTPSKTWAQADLHGIDDLNLDEPAPVHSTSSSIQKSQEPEPKVEEVDFPEFEIVDKTDGEDGDSEHATDERSASSKVVKEVVQDQVHLIRLTELDSIAQQIKSS